MATGNTQPGDRSPTSYSGLLSASKSNSPFATIDASTQIQRPQRWDVPFGEDMSMEQVEEIMETEFFSKLDEERFPKSIPLRGILLNDTRIRPYEKDEIVVREGDYGSSAFFVLEGSVSVILQSLPQEMLGRRKTKKKGIFESLRQVIARSPYPENREFSEKQERTMRDAKRGKHIFLQDVPGVLDKNQTIVLGNNELFGELGALGRTPRSSTIIANESCVLLEIRWQGLREFRNFAPDWKVQIDKLYRERSLTTHLQNTPILAGLSEEVISQIANETRFETYGNFDWHGEYKKHVESTHEERLKIEPIIAREGDYPNGLILIRNGFARVSRKYNHGERTDRYLSKGEVFGLTEMTNNWINDGQMPLARSLRAVGYLDVLIIPTSTVEKFVLPQWDPQELKESVANEMKELNAHLNEEVVSKDLADDTLEFLVENRFINGTATMLIDMTRCTRCDDCVRACAATHDNNPRFIRNGPIVENVMVANACMHCVDPVCMIGCPTGAIHREVNGQVVINDNTCIGCATCANSCPYHNIHMVPIRDSKGLFILDEQDQIPINKATKCDLCVEQIGGPSCARACPHDAMIRADMRDLDALAQFLNR